MSVYTCAYKPDPQMVDLWCYGPFFYGDSCWICSLSSPVVASGHVCPRFGVAMAIVTAIPLRRSLHTLGPPRQFSAPLGCNAQKRCFCDACWLKQGCCRFSDCWTLTFPVLVLLAHRPHADLFVDHIHAGETASKIGEERWDFFFPFLIFFPLSLI